MQTAKQSSASPRVRACGFEALAYEAISTAELFDRLSRSSLISTASGRTRLRALGETLANMAAPLDGVTETVSLTRITGRR